MFALFIRRRDTNSKNLSFFLRCILNIYVSFRKTSFFALCISSYLFFFAKKKLSTFHWVFFSAQEIRDTSFLLRTKGVAFTTRSKEKKAVAKKYFSCLLSVFFFFKCFASILSVRRLVLNFFLLKKLRKKKYPVSRILYPLRVKKDLMEGILKWFAQQGIQRRDTYLSLCSNSKKIFFLRV